MTEYEQATKLIQQFDCISNVTYSVINSRIRKNLVVQNATIHCNIKINELNSETEIGTREIKWWKGVIKQLKIQENE